MQTAIKSFFLKLFFNFIPFYRRTGGKVMYISPDETEVHIKLPHKWNTKNFVGTIYGGHIYSAIDGVHFTLFLRKFRNKYILWDKSSTIRFLKPARTSLIAKIKIPDNEFEVIHHELQHKESIERTYTVEWKDKNGTTVAQIEKVLYFKNKNMQNKKAS